MRYSQGSVLRLSRCFYCLVSLLQDNNTNLLYLSKINLFVQPSLMFLFCLGLHGMDWPRGRPGACPGSCKCSKGGNGQIQGIHLNNPLPFQSAASSTATCQNDPVMMGLLKSTMFPLQQVLEGK